MAQFSPPCREIVGRCCHRAATNSLTWGVQVPMHLLSGKDSRLGSRRAWTRPNDAATTTPARTSSSSTASSASRSTSATSPSAASRPRSSSASSAAASTSTSSRTSSTSPSTARSRTRPRRSASTSTTAGPSSSARPTARSCTGCAASSSAPPGWTSASRRASSTSPSTPRRRTFAYVQPDRDGEPVELAPEPSWGRVAYAPALAGRAARADAWRQRRRACRGDRLGARLADEQLGAQRRAGAQGRAPGSAALPSARRRAR